MGEWLLQIVRLGRTRYTEALARQVAFVERRRAGDVPDTLILTEHEPVVTLGRGTDPDEVPDAAELVRHGIEMHEASRGGKVTYHGPGQLVGYFIRDLQAAEACDLHAHVAGIEAALTAGARRLGIPAQGREGMRGVWVGWRKLASIGVAVRGWVTYHGFALNVSCDLRPFGLIAPCGMAGVEMTSVEREIGRPVAWEVVEEEVVRGLVAEFGYEEAQAAEYTCREGATDEDACHAPA